MRNGWLAPLTGVIFVVLSIAGFAFAGEPPDAGEPVGEIVSHYVDNKDSVTTGAFLIALAAMFLVFFGSYLRKALSEAEGRGGVLSAVVLAGSAVMAVGLTIDATITLALAETAGDMQPAALQALQGLWDNDFLPIALGSELLLISAGISIVLHGALPRWLGYVALGLAVVGATPLGEVAVGAGGGIWIVAVSVLLAMRARTGEHAGRGFAASSAAGA